MRKYHSHALLYLHETIALGSGRTDRFCEVFTDVYQPMMEQLDARLFGLWETTPYNGHWPQVTAIWEIDAFSDYARIGRAQARGGAATKRRPSSGRPFWPRPVHRVRGESCTPVRATGHSLS